MYRYIVGYLFEGSGKLLAVKQWLTNNIFFHNKISNISRTKSQNFNDSRLVLQLYFAQLIEARC